MGCHSCRRDYHDFDKFDRGCRSCGKGYYPPRRRRGYGRDFDRYDRTDTIYIVNPPRSHR